MLHLEGFDFDLTAKNSDVPPVVLLHGSGGRETDWTDFAQHIAPRSTCFSVRGPIAWEQGFTFFRRNPDRSLNYAELATGSERLCVFLDAISKRYGFAQPPILAGYSNGAIIAAAVVCRRREFTSGAILLRPQSPDPQTPFPNLQHYPVLILAGANERRKKGDAQVLVDQFRVAQADVSYHELNAAHGWEQTGLDRSLSKEWFAERFRRLRRV
ncbi:alpha/beta hydrolase [Ensifer aridi]|uniref:alpha/beta hydrolase n=1 Tax=Ensifer aridi TaxID=1708715 RepID=UPI0009BE984E|nr:alpha/beta fold hydrolase [Ensifer aridi]